MVSFMNNSGDIIIDATLTDAGRQRLARGDGSFNIEKFALGDDEINYTLYNTAAGTAYADLNILKTPILEAITDNLYGIRHKLMTMAREDLLYLPTAKLNTKPPNESFGGGKPMATGLNKDMFVILATENAYNAYSELPQGFIDGRNANAAGVDSQLIQVDHGLDTTEITFTSTLDADLAETQWMIQIDNRFAKIVEPTEGSGVDANPSLVDEDNIATYYLVSGGYFRGIPPQLKEASVIAGPRGERLAFGVRVSDELFNSEFLFNKFGRVLSGFFTNTGGTVSPPGLTDAKVLDTVLRLTGVTTGASKDISLRFVREA